MSKVDNLIKDFAAKSASEYGVKLAPDGIGIAGIEKGGDSKSFTSDRSELKTIITGKQGGPASDIRVRETLQTELEEAYSTIESLRKDLNEVNLLNAKLLYTNKIFKAKNLTESQKVNVLGMFDKATNVGEVKLVFETLSE